MHKVWFPKALNLKIKIFHYWSTEISLPNFKFQCTFSSVLEESKIISPSHTITKNHICSISLMWKQQLALFLYLGQHHTWEVKHQSKKYRVQTLQSSWKTERKKKKPRQAFYCIHHAMCCKYLMNLKWKNHNLHVLSMLLPTGELQQGWERAPQQPAWSSVLGRAGERQISPFWAAFPCATQHNMEQKPLWRCAGHCNRTGCGHRDFFPAK